MSNGTPLATHRTLSRHARALKALGYKSVEHVAGVVPAAADALASFLGEDVRAALPPPPPRPGVAPPGPMALGVALDRIPPRRMAFGLSVPPAGVLPPAVNLIAQMPQIRDQANRLTCVAHAALAATGERHRHTASGTAPFRTPLS